MEEVFKGEPINQEIVHVGNPIIYFSCGGTTAELNERYIVYAKHFEKDSKLYNQLYSNKCLGILPVEDSQADLDFLWNLPPVGTGGNIQGEIKARSSTESANPSILRLSLFSSQSKIASNTGSTKKLLLSLPIG